MSFTACSAVKILLIVQRQNNGDLTIDTNTPSPRPVEWDVNDPGSITITNIYPNDAGTYQCQVYLYSGNNIKGSVAMDTSNGLGVCRNSQATIAAANSTSVTTLAPTYSSGSCSPTCEWLDNSTGSWLPVSRTLQNADDSLKSSVSCTLLIPKCGSSSSRYFYKPVWKVGSQPDNSVLVAYALDQLAADICTTLPDPV